MAAGKRQDHGHVADPARRPERVRGHDHHARGLQPGADEPALRRARGPAPEAAGDRAPLHDDRPDRAAAGSVKGQGDVTRGTIYVRMNELEDRDYTQFAIQQQAREMLLDYPDLRVSVNDVSAFQGGRRPQTFQVNLGGPRPRASSPSTPTSSIADGSRSKPGLVDLDTTLSLRKPEVQVAVDREAASDLGIPVGTIADTLRVLVGGMPVSKFRTATSSTTSGSAPRPRTAASTAGPLPADAPLADRRPGQARRAWPSSIDERGPTEIERLEPRADRHRAGQPRGHPPGRGRRRGPRRSSRR